MRAQRRELEKLSDAKKVKLLDIFNSELRRMVLAGEWDGDPDEHPLQAVTRIAYDRESNNSLKLLALKTIIDVAVVPEAAKARIEAAGESGDVSITVVVQDWASNKPVIEKRADKIIDALPALDGPSRS